ncbi:hypothetical protein DRN98_06390, partial [Methanosarcinales archaeon]
MKKKAKELIERMLLALGFSLLFGIMLLGPDFRNGLGTFVGSFMNPIAALIPFHLLIVILAIVTGVYASL